MRIMRLGKPEAEITLRKVFFLSALFFAFFSFFGVYEYKIYSNEWFFLFFIYELLFYAGLASGRIVYGRSERSLTRIKYKFSLTNGGALLLWIACILSLFSFAYFVVLYRNALGSFIFGNYTANSFEESRNSLEKITLLLMQIGGDAAFLILSVDESERHKRLKWLSHVTLFLPGLRYLLMGARFAIAAEFLMLLVIKWPAIRKRIRFSSRAKREKRIIVVGAIVLGIVFLYLFASRAIYYTALERKAFNVGDMLMKPFWRKLYETTNGKIDFLCVASDYLGEAPYIFSYYCKYRMPEQMAYGQISFRSIVQIVNNLTGLGARYSDLVSNIASGQYSGFAYILIADFGVIGSFFVTYLIGLVFSKSERNKRRFASCCVIYPAIKVICFFAPIFFFYVGRLDYTILFSSLMSLFCLKRERIYDEGKCE